MDATTVGSEIIDPNQKFVYEYDFAKNWVFWLELINVSKEENPRLEYPAMVRTEGIPPSQYGTKGLVSDKLAEMEEKYDLVTGAEGFGTEGEGSDDAEEATGEETSEESAEEI